MPRKKSIVGGRSKASMRKYTILFHLSIFAPSNGIMGIILKLPMKKLIIATRAKALPMNIDGLKRMLNTAKTGFVSAKRAHLRLLRMKGTNFFVL